MTFQIVSRQAMFQRGAAAFVKGQGVDDHHMNPGAPAIADWQAGWRNAQLAYLRATKPQVELMRER